MNNKLIIGTANFGMNYGISVNQKKLLDKDIIDIHIDEQMDKRVHKLINKTIHKQINTNINK